MSPETKTCQNCKQSFTIEPEDFEFYEKMKVPPPTFCPECRFLRRAQFRNEITLYSRKCDLCEKSVVSMYNPASPYTVYCHACWDSDKWDPYSYGTDFDVTRPFFDQLKELLIKVPKKATYTSTGSGPNINSDYTNVAGGNKNCYLVFNSAKNEDCMYSRGLANCRDTLDTYFGLSGEYCYELINLNQSSSSAYGQNITNCLDSWFVFSSSDCTDCFGVINMRHGKNMFFNKQLSPDEYKSKTEEMKESYKKTEEMKRKFDEFVLTFPHRENNNLKSIDSVGNYIFESKNIQQGFEVAGCEDSKYLFSVKFSKDCYDCIGYGYSSELLLECVGVGYSSRVIGSYWVDHGRDIEYSYAINVGNNCFGCDAIKKAEYCILNKRYTPEEYLRIREIIVKELTEKNFFGLFMPPELSPFAYNETIAQDNFPLSKEEALHRGFRWQDELQVTTGKETIKPTEIPDHIKDVSDSITKETLACITCGRNYRIVETELQFYKKMLIPLPRQCFYCRHADRIRRRGQFKIFDRTCAKCKKVIKTTYAPDRPEIVYCESCYNSEVA
jgi:hypothetical protein